MLAIKLRPTGKKHQRYFRMIVAEGRSKLQGKYVDDLGSVDPHADSVRISKEKSLQWIKKGAQPTNSVHNILVREGVMKGKKIPVHKKCKKNQGEPPAESSKNLPEVKTTLMNKEGETGKEG